MQVSRSTLLVLATARVWDLRNSALNLLNPKPLKPLKPLNPKPQSMPKPKGAGWCGAFGRAG